MVSSNWIHGENHHIMRVFAIFRQAAELVGDAVSVGIHTPDETPGFPLPATEAADMAAKVVVRHIITVRVDLGDDNVLALRNIDQGHALHVSYAPIDRLAIGNDGFQNAPRVPLFPAHHPSPHLLS